MDRLLLVCLSERRFKDALTVARSFDDAYHRASALTELAHHNQMAKREAQASRNLSEALQLVPLIEEPEGNSAVVAGIAVAYARLGMHDQCFELISAIPDPSYKLEPIGALAVQSLNVGRPEKADQLLAQLLALANELASSSVEFGKFLGFEALIDAYLQIGQFDRALDVATALADVSVKDWQLLSIARRLVESGRFREAADVTDQIGQALQRAKALNALAAGYLELADKEACLRVLADLFDLYGSVEGDSTELTTPTTWKEAFFTELTKQAIFTAQLYARMGEFDQAHRCLGTVGNVPGSSMYYKIQALTDLAGQCFRSGSRERAALALSEARRAVKVQQLHSYGIQLLAGIAAQHEAIGENGKASEVLADVAHRASTTTNSEYWRVHSLEQIAMAYHKVGLKLGVAAARLLETLVISTGEEGPSVPTGWQC